MSETGCMSDLLTNLEETTSDTSDSSDSSDDNYEYVDEDCFDYMRTYKKYVFAAAIITIGIAVRIFLQSCRCYGD